MALSIPSVEASLMFWRTGVNAKKEQHSFTANVKLQPAKKS